MNIVDSSEDDARVLAIEAGVKRGDQEAFDELILILSNDNSKYARQDAAHSLGFLYDTRAIEPVIKAMLNDEKQ